MNEASLFDAAIAITDLLERDAFLDRECAGNPQLRSAMERLLSCHDASNPLDRPAYDLPTQSIDEDQARKKNDVMLGDTIDRYKLLEKIGEGGFGNVYVAEQEKPVRRRVAIKVIKPGMDSKQVIGRFEAERQALAMMDHINIAKVLDAGTTENGRPYFVMELVHGRPITTYCDENQLSPRERLELFIPVCQAIQHAHQKGIIHRDIKPSNVLVTMYDDRAVPKVIDFGVSKALDQRLTEKTVYTQYGTMVGTLEYVSPEQAEMNAFGVDTRSDVYSLGALLYELLTGTPPLDCQEFHSTAYAEMIRKIKEQDPSPPSLRIRGSETLQKVAAARRTEPARLSAEVRGELDWIVMRCLEKDRARRYEGASALAQDVHRYLANEPVDACPPTVSYRLRKAYQKHRSAVWTASLLASALIVVAVVSLSWAFSSRRAARKANLLQQQAQNNAELAINNSRLAEERSKQVAASREELAKFEYAASMKLAQLELQRGNALSVRRLLDRSPNGRREWEWNYLDRAIRSETLCLAGHMGFNRAASFSPDGTKILTANEERRACLWDAKTGELIRLFDAPTANISDASFDPSGTRILIAMRDFVRRIGELRVFDTSTGELLLTLPQESTVWTARFDRDGKRIVAACGNDQLVFWDASTGKLLTTIQSSIAYGVNFHSNGLLASGHRDGVARLWDPETGQLIKEFPGHAGPVHGIAISPDGRRMISSGVDAKVIVWDLGSKEQLLTLNGHQDEVRAVAFSPDGNLIVTGSDDRTACIWDASSGTLKKKFVGHLNEIRSAAFSPDGESIITGSSDGTAKSWKIADDAPYPFQERLSPDHVQQMSVDGRRLLIKASAAEDSTKRYVYQVWDAQKEAVLLEVDRPDEFRMFVARLSNDGNYVFGFSSDSEFTVWNVNNKKRLCTFDTPHAFSNIAINHDARILAISRRDRAVSLWDLRAGTHLLDLDVPDELTASFAFCPHQRTIAGGGSRGTLTIWDAETGQIRHTIKRGSIEGHSSSIVSTNFNHDGSYVVTASADGTAKLWRVQDGTHVQTLIGHNDGLTAAQFSPDGTRILTSSARENDLTARIWETSTGLEILTIPLSKQSRDPVFSADGSCIFIASQRQSLQILRGDPKAIAQVQMAMAPRDAWFAQQYPEPQRKLWNCAAEGDIDGVKAALRDGADVNAMDSRYKLNGRHALNYAVKRNDGQMVKLLIDSGANIDLQNYTGYTALHHAAEFNALTAAKQLFDAGANPNLTNDAGLTPLEFAKSFGRYDFANEIQRVTTIEPQRKLWNCAAEGDMDGVKAALSDGADINAMDSRNRSNGRYALNYAAQRNDSELSRFLIDAGANINLQNHTGFTALHHAAEYNALTVAKQLIDAGANPNLTTHAGLTPLELAKRCGHNDVARELERVATNEKTLRGTSNE